MITNESRVTLSNAEIPVAWLCRFGGDEGVSSDPETIRYWQKKGWKVTPLYTTPRAAEADWLPIESAPKDGMTRILCCDEHGPYVGYRPTDCPDDAVCDIYGIACYPTHWMPLPEPPK